MVLIQFPQTETAHGSGRARLGDYLCARGTLNQEQLRLALHEQKIAHELLGKVLVRCKPVIRPYSFPIIYRNLMHWGCGARQLRAN